MRREALFERASWFKGEWTDLAVYAIRADEWRAGPPD
jgi:aminoglycoside 6'-N-acetyltransferase